VPPPDVETAPPSPRRTGQRVPTGPPGRLRRCPGLHAGSPATPFATDSGALTQAPLTRLFSIAANRLTDL